jgi:hypothetical protein
MKKLKNTPVVKMGLVAVSRDCFPIELSRARLKAVAAECRKTKVKVTTCSVVIESETDAMAAVAAMRPGWSASTTSSPPGRRANCIPVRIHSASENRHA